MSVPALSHDLFDKHALEERLDPGLLSRLALLDCFLASSAEFGIDYWAVTGYDAVTAASKNSHLSSAAQGTVLGPRPKLPTQSSSLTELDDPRHRQLRKVVSRWFSARNVLALEAYVRQSARSIVSGLDEGARFDCVADIARPLPAAVVGKLLGIPEEDRDDVARWGVLLNMVEDPAFADEIQRERPYERLAAYAYTMASRCKQNTGDDLIGALLDPAAAGGSLTLAEFESMFVLLVAAGTSTTVDLITSAVEIFSADEAAVDLLRTSDAWASAVEEVLRLRTPVAYFARTALEPVRIGKMVIPAGDSAALVFAAANMDPRIFDDPQTLRLDRIAKGHVTFGGGGPHLCLGAALARLEARVLLQELYSCRRTVLDGAPTRLVSHISNGYVRMPVRVVAG